MPSVSDVELVLADLEDAFKALNSAVSSPKLVRQSFSRFVELTQRLTAVMRKDWSARRGGTWAANTFPGWNATTALFKELRNQEQHEQQIYISVEETRYYELFGPGGGRIAYSGTWKLTDQLAASPPDWMRLYDSDPVTGAKTNVEIPHCAVAYKYLLQPRDHRTAELVRAAGKSGIHELSSTCMTTLREYCAFYRSSIDA